MKKIFKKVIFALVAALPAFTSCNDDNDSNPVLAVPETFVLNTPELAANNVYDLPQSDSVYFSTTQPDYGGWPASVTYVVQVALSEDMANLTELATTSTKARIGVSGTELNQAVLDLYRAQNEDADPDANPMPIYIRLRAFIADGGEHFGEVLSNSVSITVLSYDAPSDATLPTALYVCGNSIADAWSTWKPLAPVYGKEGRFYTIIYNDNDGFKWGTKEQEWLGYDNITEFDDQAGCGISQDGDGNIVLGQAGWYVIEFISKIVGNDVQYTLVVAPGKASIIGGIVGDDAWAGGSYLVAPDSRDELWESAAFTASGELRAYIEVPGEDWWRTEFTILEGELYFRNVDIPSNWATDLGDEYSVTVLPDQKLYINFDRNTAEVR